MLKRFLFNHNNYYDGDPDLNTGEDFYICLKENYNKIRIELVLHRVNRYGQGNINLSIEKGFISVDYLDKNISLSLEDVKNDIVNNEKDIYNNKKDIQNIKNDSHYKLKNIYTYDIPVKNQFVDKNNDFHIFEKDIINNFKKDSFLEVSIKLLTEISNYILIGFFEILCIFYNENYDLFYEISLSTAMGSINKLSTIKSVFIVPIDKDMPKIKIDFYIRNKPSQQSRSATYSIIDINSNKIYIKYFQK